MKRLLVVLTVLSFVLPTLLTACGGGGEKTYTATPTATSTGTTMVTTAPTVIFTATITPTSSEPVKIGVTEAWSGPLAASGILCDQIIAVLEKQVKDRGGVLGGREVKFVRGDDRGVVAEWAAQAEKLILDDKVSILTVGGNTEPSYEAIASIAEELKVPFIPLSVLHNIEKYKYTICLFSDEMYIKRFTDPIIDVLKPKTVAWLGHDVSDAHDTLHGFGNVVGVKDRLKAAGIDIVYEDYFPLGTQDFSPYLTKIKYVNPDVVICYINDTGQAVAIAKQIQGLGGWGSIKYYATDVTSPNVLKQPSMLGNYVSVMWLPGSNEPGMKAYEDGYKEMYGRLPDPGLTFFYNSIGTAIKAIELAGSDDPEKIAQAMHSGNLEWDSAWGPMLISTDGVTNMSGMVAQVQEGGKMVKVWPQ